MVIGIISMAIILTVILIVGLIAWKGRTIVNWIWDTIEWNINRIKWKYWDKD